MSTDLCGYWSSCYLAGTSEACNNLGKDCERKDYFDYLNLSSRGGLEIKSQEAGNAASLPSCASGPMSLVEVP